METAVEEHRESGEEQTRLEEAAFRAAQATTGRSAFEQYKKTGGDIISFRALPLLLDPYLHTLAYRAIAEARGPVVDGNTSFPLTVWTGGATKTKRGRPFLGTFADFVRLLEERSLGVAPKREGWVVEPTTNTDGHRTNASTIAIHALFLDCDGTGEWNTLLSFLKTCGFAYVAYRSGGHSATLPKWRIVLPLSSAFDTSDETKQTTWKAIYNCCRAVFGAVGGLLGVGFDPATDTPCCPWFLTEKRDANDPQREIVCRVGYSLDLVALALALPPIEIEQPKQFVHREVTSEGLSDEKLNAIIDALSRATASIPSGRHELYLALPGVLLDRGVPADEVLAIVEAVSASYPRKHLDKHRDNVHNAKTTIAKWEGGGAVTRIGTLNDRWPEIAKAVDDVLPNPLAAALEASTTEMLMQQTTMSVGEPLAMKKRRRRLSPLAKEILPVAVKMKKSSNAMRKFGGTLIERMIDGESFQAETTAQVDALVALTMEAFGFNSPSGTTWRQILDLANHTLLSMDFTQSIERVNAAELAFMKGQRKRRNWNAKRQAEVDAQKQSTRDFFNEARSLKWSR